MKPLCIYIFPRNYLRSNLTHILFTINFIRKCDMTTKINDITYTKYDITKLYLILIYIFGKFLKI